MPSIAILRTTAARLLREAEARHELLPHYMRDNSRWLMLLALFDADEPLTVTQLSNVSRAPMTTAANHLENLVASKLVRRDAHHSRNVAAVCLTDEGSSMVIGYLRAL